MGRGYTCNISKDCFFDSNGCILKEVSYIYIIRSIIWWLDDCKEYLQAYNKRRKNTTLHKNNGTNILQGENRR